VTIKDHNKLTQETLSSDQPESNNSSTSF